MSSVLLHLLALIMFFNDEIARGRIIPPNYNFSLDSLEVFHPGKTLLDIEKRYGKGEIIKKGGKIQLMRFYIKQDQYRFSVKVQVKGGKVIDFFANLPSYFLHDVFHQSLINRLGKQTRYFRQENSAVYIWENKGGTDFIYRATCTITCFPIYLTGRPSKSKDSKEGSPPSIIEWIKLPSP